MPAVSGITVETKPDLLYREQEPHGEGRGGSHPRFEAEGPSRYLLEDLLTVDLISMENN